MYVVYDKNYNIIAFHEDYDVCEEYVENVFKYNKNLEPGDLSIDKLKKKSKYKLENKDDLYLVRYANTYVQNGYLWYLEVLNGQLIDDDKYCLDVLKRILETSNISKDEYKVIKKAIVVVERLTDEDCCYTPSLDYLKRIKLDYDPYIYNNGVW